MPTTNLGLSVNDVVSVLIQLAALGAQQRNFGSLIVLGDSNVIDVVQRYRLYTSASSVGTDFGTSAPEYLAAVEFFDQSPQPAQMYIGRWARTATNGALVGGALSPTQQAIANFTVVTNGGLTVTVDSTPHALTGINLSAVTNLNGVASDLQTALSGVATVIWDAANAVFRVFSATTGAASAVSFATAPGSGTDISGLMGLTAAAGGYVANGIIAESPLACVNTFLNLTNNWYGSMFAASVMPADSDYVAVAGAIQSATVSRIFGVTTQEANALNAGNSSDVASLLKALGYTRTFVQYSSSSPYATAAIYGIAFTVDFTGANTVLTLKFKQESGIVAETLTETQAAALIGKNCNVFVNYNNGVAIVQNGVMASGQFFDVINGTDWLQNFIQTTLFNLLVTSPTKLPQTDAGVSQLVNGVTGCCEQAVTNGLVAPGVWTGPAVGVIVNGQTLITGYYVYAPPVASQAQSARAARQAPLIQAAIKLAGAIHSSSVIVSVQP
jgi:hypothetical protein